MKKFMFSNVWLLDGNENDLLEICLSASKSRKNGLHVHFINNHVMQITFQDKLFLSLLNESNSAVVIDGKSIETVLRFFSFDRKIVKQIRGVDFMKRVLNSNDTKDFNHFFLGGTPQTLNSLVLIAEKTSTVAGGYSPPFGPLGEMNIGLIVEQIVASGANLIWVGLGTPKQDYVAQKVAAITKLPTLCVGAAFDFYAGGLPEAPKILRRLGLEWLFRLLQEPGRLWKRYLIGNWSIFRVIFRELFDKK